jgi:peptidoglycan hydrolase CwlO-like protein
MFIVYILILIFILLLSCNFILGNNVIEGLKTKTKKTKQSKQKNTSQDIKMLQSKVDKLTNDFKELNDKVNTILENQTPDEITPDIMTGVIETFTPF